MYVSARRKFCEGDANWSKYISWIGLKHVQEVRSLDRHINFILPSTDMCDCVMGDYRTALRRLPSIEPDIHYYQLAVNMTYETPPTWVEQAQFLGCDLADDCWRSGVLNYGPWAGEMAKLALHVNQYGLLRLSDARTAKHLMATLWDRAFSHIDLSIWGLYELPADRVTLPSTAIGEKTSTTGESRDIPIE